MREIPTRNIQNQIPMSLDCLKNQTFRITLAYLIPVTVEIRFLENMIQIPETVNRRDMYQAAMTAELGACALYADPTKESQKFVNEAILKSRKELGLDQSECQILNYVMRRLARNCRP